MATTTNYSWTTPDDTDLVKDGASAIRTLGSSADTTVKNLNPGTTAGDVDYYTSATAKARVGIGTAGQVFKVNSGATAPEWGADPVADVITTAGDLIYGTAADTVARLGIGTAGQVLKVNSGATAPEWGAAAAGGAYTSLATGSLTGASVTISSISAAFEKLVLVIRDASLSNSDEITIRLNGKTSNYSFGSTRAGSAAGQYGFGNQIKVPAGNVLNTATNYKAVIEFPDYSTSGLLFCYFSGNFNTTSTTSGVQSFFGYGGNDAAEVLDSITIKADFGGAYTFDNGTFELFGVK